MCIRRLSSRTNRLSHSFLQKYLQKAKNYRRIAGYFSSSLFEVAGEYLENIPHVQIVCNVDMGQEDLKIAELCSAKLMSRWHDKNPEGEILLKKERYRLLNNFLHKHKRAIRVVPNHYCGFLHGKAGIIELVDGRKLGFIGSMNETKSGWEKHYEILWEDESPEGIDWIEEEFHFLWEASQPLPNCIAQEIYRLTYRQEVLLNQIKQEVIAPAVLIESPLFREGLSLQPWQKGFIAECLQHYQHYPAVRLLLADEVGLGKTLSLGAAALILCLVSEQKRPCNRKPIVILAPATLCEQWQTEMMDKLAIPCARWNTQKKAWMDIEEHIISPIGPEHVRRCPMRIGIISTGLIIQDTQEKAHLLALCFGLVVLDEAHKARTKRGLDFRIRQPNEILKFMKDIASHAEHVLLGTATPIQTQPEDLWDLIAILSQNKGRFILGHQHSPWHKPKEVLPILAGQQVITEINYAWELLRSSLPLKDSTHEPHARKLFTHIRQNLGVKDSVLEANKSLTELKPETIEILKEELDRDIHGTSFFQRENPLVRHIILRKRATLEEQKLLPKIGVLVHPNRQLAKHPEQFDRLFENNALSVRDHFRAAYDEVCILSKTSGLLKNVIKQRICSSLNACSNTIKTLLNKESLYDEEREQEKIIPVGDVELHASLIRLSSYLKNIDEDPKLDAVIYYLEQECWLERGTIIFSQYYDTSLWIAQQLARRYPNEPIGLYAGAARSQLYQHQECITCRRETLKKMVSEEQIRLIVATDAACEGLNLQALGTLINIDLPWNPTRLEQRIGRIKRFGQKRDTVDVLHLVYQQTVDEKIYQCLSERMKNRYDLFGSIPDVIEDEWIEHIELLHEEMDKFIKTKEAATGFDLRYKETMKLTETEADWGTCTEVLSRRDLTTLMNQPWSES